MNLEVQKLDIKPGERLLVRASGRIMASQRRVICETIREAYPGVPFAVVDPTLEVTVGQWPTEVCEAPEA